MGPVPVQRQSEAPHVLHGRSIGMPGENDGVWCSMGEEIVSIDLNAVLALDTGCDGGGVGRGVVTGPNYRPDALFVEPERFEPASSPSTTLLTVTDRGRDMFGRR